jgi:hypothetical protein
MTTGSHTSQGQKPPSKGKLCPKRGNGSTAILFLLFLFWQFCPSAVVAQTAGTGAMNGTVTDGSGTVIKGAIVIATNADTSQIRTTTTNSHGGYSFALLTPGAFQVTFSAIGFKTLRITSVIINVADTRILNGMLEPGPQTEEVIILWEAQGVRTSGSAGGGLVGESDVRNLPLTSRNYTQILGLSAGVTGEVSNASAMGSGSRDIHIAVGMQSGYSIDGDSIGNPSSNVGTPNPDSIREFSVQSWHYDVGLGRTSGANINVITKSGTNAFHGTLFEFVRNDIFNANEFFRNRNGLSRPVLKQNQFGFTFGGPIKQNKLFFFSSYQGTRQRNGLDSRGFASSVTLPPLPETRTAASVGAAFCPENHPGDDRFRTFFGGVQVACDGSNINPVALNILNLKLPDGSYYIPGSGTETFQTSPFSIPAKFREDQFLINTDYVISDNHVLTQKAFYSRAPRYSSFAGGSTSLPGGPTDGFNTNLNVQVRLTSVLGASFTNEVRMSFHRSISNVTPLIPFTNEQVGIKPLVSELDKLNVIDISGLFVAGGVSNAPGTDWQYQTNNVYQWADQISWVHRNHSIRAGFEIARAQWNLTTPGVARGILTFMSFGDFLLGLPGCPPGSTTCNSNSPVVDGMKTNGSAFSNIYGTDGVLTEPGGIYHAYRLTYSSAFIQDDIKLSSRLTMNLGVRWNYNGFPYDLHGDATTVWTSLIQTQPVPPENGTYAGYVVPSNFRRATAPGVYRNVLKVPTATSPSLSNFAPRFGLAWRPFGSSRFSVRTGYGIFLDRPNEILQLKLSEQTVPYATPLSTSGTANYFSTFDQPFRSAVLGWGMPRTVNFAAGTSSNLSVRALQENFGVPTTQKWNLDIQWEFLPRWTFQLGYAGSRSIRLQQAMHQINGALLASPSNPINGITENTVQNATLRVRYLGFAPRGVDHSGTDASSNYNSLQVTLRNQRFHGVQFQVAYTFSRAFTDLGAGSSMSSSMSSNDPNDPRQQYGLATSIRPQRLVLNYSWELPYKGSGVPGKLFGGWSVSGVTTYQSGLPMTVNDRRGGTIYGSPGISRVQFCPEMGAADMPTSGSVKDRLDAYFNRAAICDPPVIGNGTGYGNSGIGIIRGPAQANWDMALRKNIIVGEGRFEFRTEFFNAFNHPQFSTPGVNLMDAVFGKITSTSVNPRLIQFGLKYNF